MAHWRKLFDGKHLGAWDLYDEQGNELTPTVTIERVKKQTVKGEDGETGKPVIWFAGQKKPWIAGVVSCETIARLYGDDFEGWIGKRITLYPTTTSSPKGVVPCIRVKPVKPPPANGRQQPRSPEPPPQSLDQLEGQGAREPGAEG